MANLKSMGRTTSDRKDVGVAAKHATSMSSARGAGKGAGAVNHPGQPMSLGGKGLKTGHSATNC